MSYQDGLGTWVWNESVEIDGVVSYSFNFVSSNQTYDNIRFNGNSSKSQYMINYVVDGSRDIVYSNIWVKVAYRTINITSTPPADFLAILQTNATYQEPAVTTYKLTINGKRATINGKSKGTLTFNGVTYEWDNTSAPVEDELLGTWYFNESITQHPLQKDYSLQFDSDDRHYKGITFTNLSLPNLSGLTIFYQRDSAGDEVVYDYFTDDSGAGWYNETYRTITITDTSTLTNRDEFTTWLKANAVKQSQQKKCLAGYHMWDDGVATTRPSYIADGVTTYTCICCGAIKTETIPKLQPVE